jgi:uncharacterized protein YbjT (DUF2867 family)
MTRKVLITGATGDTGRSIVRESLALKLQVRVFRSGREGSGRFDDRQSIAALLNNPEAHIGQTIPLSGARKWAFRLTLSSISAVRWRITRPDICREQTTTSKS